MEWKEERGEEEGEKMREKEMAEEERNGEKWRLKLRRRVDFREKKGKRRKWDHLFYYRREEDNIMRGQNRGNLFYQCQIVKLQKFLWFVDAMHVGVGIYDISL